MTVQVFFLEGFEFTDPGAGKKGAVEGEKGVLGGGSDQDQGALLQVGKKRVLLALVEVVDLVQEKDGGLLVKFFASRGLVEHLAQVGQARCDGVHGYEAALGAAGHQASEGRLASSGRAVEDQGNDAVGFQKAAKKFAGAQQVLLAHVFLKGPGGHADGRGRVGAPSRFLGVYESNKIHKW